MKFQILTAYLSESIRVLNSRDWPVGVPIKMPAGGRAWFALKRLLPLLFRCFQTHRDANNPVLSMVITGTFLVAMVVVMPASVREKEAATQGQDGKEGNQPGDSTEHFKILMVTPS
jgi:hypothetical protein